MKQKGKLKTRCENYCSSIPVKSEKQLVRDSTLGRFFHSSVLRRQILMGPLKSPNAGKSCRK